MRPKHGTFCRRATRGRRRWGSGAARRPRGRRPRRPCARRHTVAAVCSVDGAALRDGRRPRPHVPAVDAAAQPHARADGNVYLFHQLVGQLYFLSTRPSGGLLAPDTSSGSRRSRSPSDGRSTSSCSSSPPGSRCSSRASTRGSSRGGRRRSARCCGGGGERQAASTLDIVLDEIEKLTGAPVEPDWSLADCGRVSTPIVVNRLTHALPGVSLRCPTSSALRPSPSSPAARRAADRDGDDGRRLRSR